MVALRRAHRHRHDRAVRPVGVESIGPRGRRDGIGLAHDLRTVEHIGVS